MRYLWTEDTGAGLHFWKLVNQLFLNNELVVESRVVLQNVLDGLVLNLLPFGLIMGTWQLLKKKVSPIVVVLLLMAIGINRILYLEIPTITILYLV